METVQTNLLSLLNKQGNAAMSLVVYEGLILCNDIAVNQRQPPTEWLRGQ